MSRNNWLSFLIVLLFLPAFTNCNKLIDAGSPAGIAHENIFSDDSAVLGGLVGIYYRMMADQGCLFNGGISVLGGLSADELTPLQVNVDFDFFVNDVKGNNPVLEDMLWNKGYRYIYHCNTLLEGLSKAKNISAAMQDRVTGESLFLRAFCYYYLTQLFGDVPLVLSTDASNNALLPRTPVLIVLQYLLFDLEKAVRLLDNKHGNRFAGKLACETLLARINLQLGDWESAEQYSSAVIESGSCQLESKLEGVFNKSSKEVIFQLQPVAYPENSIEGYLFLPPRNGAEPIYTLSLGLVNSFEQNDLRKLLWIKTVTINGISYHAPYKYRMATASSPSNEYNVVMRLAELYLLRAEARARQQDITGAVADLNRIRKRAGLTELAATSSQVEVLQAVEQERRHELFTEWGHRWFDLKRTGRAESVLRSKWQYWKSTCQLYPIPVKQIEQNPNLQQNEGY